MVRAFVSAGAVMAYSWSALLGAAQAGTLTLGSNSDTVISFENPVSNPSNGNVNNWPGNVVITPDPISVLILPIIIPPTPPPSFFPAPTDGLPIQRSKVRLVTGRWGSAVFYGVIEGNSERSSGQVRFVLNRAGRGSASVILNGSTTRKTIPIEMDDSGNVAPTNRSATTIVSVSGALTTFSDGSVGFDAVVTNEGVPMPVRVLSASPSPEVVEAVKGRYTLLFATNTSGVMLYPGGTGFGMLQVNKRGYVAFTGRLSDGSTFSQGTRLNSAGKWALYSNASSGATLSGNVRFEDLSESDCSGTLQWERRAIGQVVINQSANLSLRGSRYVAAEGLGVVPQWQFQARSGANALQVSASLEPRPQNELSIRSAGIDQTQLTLNRTNGKLTGSFLRSGNADRQKALGVIFQKTEEAFGLTKPLTARATATTAVLAPSWSGIFTLEAKAFAQSEVSSSVMLWAGEDPSAAIAWLSSQPEARDTSGSGE